MMMNENKAIRAHWDESDADIGVYRLMLDGENILRIQDIEKYYRDARRKPDCRYLLSMCIWGSSHDHELVAETIEAAQAECEAWLADHLGKRIAGLQKGIVYFQGLLNVLKEREN